MALACTMMDIDQARLAADSALLARTQYSLQQFESLQAGMTYVHAKSIMGADGAELSPGELTEPPTRMYRWRNSNGSQTSALFQNDALVGKMQVGLE